MTLRECKKTGDAGLLAELWEHCAYWRRELTDADLKAALGDLIPAGHKVVAVSDVDHALAESRAQQQQQQQEQEEEEEAESEESESDCESDGEGAVAMDCE